MLFGGVVGVGVLIVGDVVGGGVVVEVVWEDLVYYVVFYLCWGGEVWDDEEVVGVWFG